MKICEVEGCHCKVKAKGYCSKHYTQLLRYGKVFNKTIKDKTNKIIQYENYAEIILLNLQSEEIGRVIIDKDDIDKVKDFKWHLSHGYARNNEIGFLHRLIMNCPQDMVVDHINHNPLDNRKSNLRICTQQENMLNQSVRKDNTSGHKGICWNKEKNKWQSSIYINGKKKHLGYFNTKEEAIKVRQEAEIKYFSEYRYKE